MKRILIVEDDKDMALILKSILLRDKYVIKNCFNGSNALAQLTEFNPHIVITDINLPGLNGIDLLKQAKVINPEIVVIMITAYGNFKDSVSAMKMGAYDYIIKPFNNEELQLVIKKAFETIDLKKEVVYLRKELAERKSNFIGESTLSKKMLKHVSMIAPTDVTVILFGKSGTGKEVLAKMLHEQSGRSGGPFVAVDCGAIPDTLVESEFFGHEKGSFTGANALKIGKFEQADGGTLFLDEVSNLPRAMQAVLLRVLQERRLTRIGGAKQIDFDIRVVVASNICLQDLVDQKEFREDLYYRLNQFMITIPTLAEREGDIPILADYFLKKFSQQFGKSELKFDTKALSKMLNYSWPGNIREMENVIRKAVLLCDTNIISYDLISVEAVKTTSIAKFENLNLEQNKKDTEKRLIEQVLEMTQGNRIAAAEKLGISRKSLYLKIKDLNISF